MKLNGAGKATSAHIDELLRTQREEVAAVIRKFKTLTSAKRREYGSAALFLIASLDLAIHAEKKRQQTKKKTKRKSKTRLLRDQAKKAKKKK
jgi:hypothetical protein